MAQGPPLLRRVRRRRAPTGTDRECARSSSPASGLSLRYRRTQRAPARPCRRGSFCAIRATSSSASSSDTTPISRAVASATRRLPRSIARRRWPSDVPAQSWVPLRGRAAIRGGQLDPGFAWPLVVQEWAGRETNRRTMVRQDESGRVHHPFEPWVLGATLAMIPVLIIERDAESHTLEERRLGGELGHLAGLRRGARPRLVVVPRKRAPHFAPTGSTSRSLSSPPRCTRRCSRRSDFCDSCVYCGSCGPPL